MVYSFGGTDNVQTLIQGNLIDTNGGWGIDASADKMRVTENIVLNNTSGEINLTGANNILANNIVA